MARKKRGRPETACSGGFTLLELLISMTLLVVIVVITMGAMRIGARSVTAGEKRMDVQERLRTSLSIIDAQIQSQTPLTYMEDGNRKYYFKGDGKTLRFSTNHSIWGGQKGYVVVEYKVETNPSGTEALYASESTPGLEGHRDTRLIESSRITFAYFRKEPAEEQGKWLDALTEGNAIPERVRISLVDGSREVALVFPVRVRGEIAQVQGATPVSVAPAPGNQNLPARLK